MESSDQLGFVLVQVCRAHRQWVDAELQRLGVHVGQEMILFRLFGSEAIAQSELAAHLCIEPPTVTKMLQRMERSGLVVRHPAAHDGRMMLVSLTAQGHALEPAIRAVWQRLDAVTIAGLTEAEELLLRRLLRQVRDNLGRP